MKASRHSARLPGMRSNALVGWLPSIAYYAPLAHKLLKEPRFEIAGKADALACRQAIEDRIFDGIAADDKDGLTVDVRALQGRAAETGHALRGRDLATEPGTGKGIDMRLMLPVAATNQRRLASAHQAGKPQQQSLVFLFCLIAYFSMIMLH